MTKWCKENKIISSLIVIVIIKLRMPNYNQSTTLIKRNNQPNIRYLPEMSTDKTQPRQTESWSHFVDCCFLTNSHPWNNLSRRWAWTKPSHNRQKVDPILLIVVSWQTATLGTIWRGGSTRFWWGNDVRWLNNWIRIKNESTFNKFHSRRSRHGVDFS